MSRRPLSILVADPDSLTSETITEMLRAHGHGVIAVTEIVEALSILDQVLFDVLIVPVDRQLSMLDLSFAPVARRKQPNIKVIGISGDIDQPTVASTATIEVFLRKPFGLKQLDGALHQITGEQAVTSPLT